MKKCEGTATAQTTSPFGPGGLRVPPVVDIVNTNFALFFSLYALLFDHFRGIQEGVYSIFCQMLYPMIYCLVVLCR